VRRAKGLSPPPQRGRHKSFTINFKGRRKAGTVHPPPCEADESARMLILPAHSNGEGFSDRWASVHYDERAPPPLIGDGAIEIAAIEQDDACRDQIERRCSV
jgi:hypothetical protein